MLLAVGFRTNPEILWLHLANGDCERQSHVLKEGNEQQTVTDQETADVFCNYFSEVFVIEDSRKDDTTQHQTEDNSFKITESKVK